MDAQQVSRGSGVELAEVIAQALQDNGLIRPEKRDEVANKLATGTMRTDEWRLEIELPAEKAQEEQDDA